MEVLFFNLIIIQHLFIRCVFILDGVVDYIFVGLDCIEYAIVSSLLPCIRLHNINPRINRTFTGVC